MKMKKIILMIVLLLFFASLVSAEESEDRETGFDVFFSGEVWSGVGYYIVGDTKLKFGVFASIEGDINSKWIWYTSIQATTGSLERDGADIFTRDGEVSIVSLREAYSSSDSWRIGKQVLADEMCVKFDFMSLNLFETRDLSRPFSALDEDRRLGNWGVAKSFVEGRLKLVAVMAEPPMIATDEDDPWTRQLPKGLYYGDVETEVDYSMGLRWGDDVGDVKYDVYFQHGSGNSPVDVNINPRGEVRTVIAEQTAVSGSLQKPLGEWSLRLGAAGYFQSSYSDFIVGVAELERFWEFENGSIFFVDIGFADVWEMQSGDGIPDLDLRRIYEGGTVLATAEYSFDHSSLELRGAYNVKNEGLYFSSEVSWAVTDSVDLSLKYEMIDGRSDSGPNSIWAEHSDDDNVSLRIIFIF